MRTISNTDMWELWIPQAADWINLNDRPHWAKRAKLTKAWRNMALIMARQARLPKGLGRVRVTAFVHKTRGGRWDAHNLVPTAKAIADGLVDHGLVVDDDNTRFTGPDMRAGEVQSKPGITLVIEAL